MESMSKSVHFHVATGKCLQVSKPLLLCCLSGSDLIPPHFPVHNKIYHHPLFTFFFPPFFFGCCNPSRRFPMPDHVKAKWWITLSNTSEVLFFLLLSSHPQLPPTSCLPLCIVSVSVSGADYFVLPMEKMYRYSGNVFFFCLSPPLKPAMLSGLIHNFHTVYVCGLQTARMKIGPCVFLH